MSVDRSKAPGFYLPESFDLTPPVSGTTATGVSVFFFPTPGIEAVKIEVVGQSSRHFLPIDQQLVPSFTLQMLQEGTRTKSDAEIANYLDFHASEISIHLSYTQEGIQLVSTKKHLSEVLPLFLDLFTECTFPDSILEKRKTQRKLSLQLEREKNASRASVLFRKALFGDSHHYGAEVISEQVDLIDSTTLRHYYNQNLWTNLTVFVAGNLNSGEFEQLVKDFSKIPNRAKSIKSYIQPPATVHKIHEERANSVQTSIRLGSWSVSKTHADFQALSVFNTMLGGYFGSRLIKNIREDKGHTYGISSHLVEIGDFNYWVIGADVEKSKTSLVIDEIHQEIQRLINEPISADELETVRNYLLGQLLSRFSSSFELIDRFRAVHDSGLDFGYYHEKFDFLKKFTAEQLQEVGKKYFSGNTPVEVTVG